MFPEVYVNLRYDFKDVNAPAFSGVDGIIYNMNAFEPTKRATLEVYGEYQAEVTCEFGRYANRDLVISCLYAALRNIGDSAFHHAVRTKLVNQLNAKINADISKSIGHIYEAKKEHDEVTKYFIDIDKVVIGKYPVDIAFATYEGSFVYVEVRYGGKVYVSKEIIPEYGTIDSHKSMTADAICRAFSNLYKDYPELSYVWAQSETTFHIELGKVVTNDFNFLENYEKMSYYSPKFLQESASKKDDRIEKLPGISESVRHPVDGRQLPLANAIISLNDVHKWTREQIADWLETLDIDLRFKNEQD